MKTTIKAILVISIFAFFACDKSSTSGGEDLTATDLSSTQLKSASIAVNDVAIESVAEDANIEIEFYAGYENMLRQLAHFKGKKGNLLAGMGHFHYVEGQLPAVSIDTAEAGYPITILIDYGAGIQTNHGRVISGKVTIELSGPHDTDGSKRTVTYDNCAIDLIKINGVRTETFNGDNKTTRKITCESNVTFILADGTNLAWNGTDVRDWIAGLDTPKERDDDQIQITGKVLVISTLTDVNGVVTTDNYSREIIVPLLRIEDCKHPVSGTIELKKNDATATLDYGDGTCDNLATLTTGDATVEIELKDLGMPKAKTEGQHKGKMNGNGHKGGMSGGMNGGH